MISDELKTCGNCTHVKKMTNKEWLDSMSTSEMLELFDMLFYAIDNRCNSTFQCASQDKHWDVFVPAFMEHFEPIYAQDLANRRGHEWDDEPAKWAVRVNE